MKVIREEISADGVSECTGIYSSREFAEKRGYLKKYEGRDDLTIDERVTYDGALGNAPGSPGRIIVSIRHK